MVIARNMQPLTGARGASRVLRAMTSCPSQAPRIAARASLFSTSARRHSFDAPLNITKWASENAHLLKPPINNYCVTNDPQTVMVVGGPNARTDYHINTTPEFFYQHRGAMLLKTVQPAAQPGGAPVFKDIPIHEGSIYLLPANVPHNPVRFADTVGVVIEQPRPEGALDRLRWYCQGCGEQVAERAFVCTDLGSQIKDAVQAFEKDTHARTCKSCGTVCDVRPPDVEKLRPRPEA